VGQCDCTMGRVGSGRVKKSGPCPSLSQSQLGCYRWIHRFDGHCHCCGHGNFTRILPTLKPRSQQAHEPNGTGTNRNKSTQLLPALTGRAHSPAHVTSTCFLYDFLYLFLIYLPKYNTRNIRSKCHNETGRTDRPHLCLIADTAN